MKRIILLITLFTFSIFNVSAQTKKDKIRELYRLMYNDSLMTGMLENMNMIRSTITPFNKKRDSLYNDFVKSEIKTMIEKMNDKYMVEVYDKYFTIGEIQKYIDFYRSPEGQKMKNLSPAIFKDLMTVMMTNYMPELKVKFKTKLEELNN